MNLKQRKPGEWVIDFTLRGKRIRRIIKGTRRMAEQAITFERERIYRQKFGIPEPKKKISFEEYSKIYADNYTKEKKAPRNEMYIINRLNSFFKGRILYEITPGDVDRLKQKRKKAGIKNLTAHDLRHTAASFLVNDCGVSVAVASEILGHSKLEMTMKYVHSTPEHRQVGVERLGEIFKISRHKVDKSPSTAEIQTPTSPHINVH